MKCQWTGPKPTNRDNGNGRSPPERIWPARPLGLRTPLCCIETLADNGLVPLSRFTEARRNLTCFGTGRGALCPRMASTLRWTSTGTTRSEARDGRGTLMASVQRSGDLWDARLHGARTWPGERVAAAPRKFGSRSAAIQAAAAALRGPTPTASERKQRDRTRYRAQGLVRFEAWVSPAERSALQALLLGLRTQRRHRDGTSADRDKGETR
jgi:hypothetical protein